MGTCLGTFRTHSDIMGSKCLSRTKSQGSIDNASPVSGVIISHAVLTAGLMPQERGSPVHVAITLCGDTHICPELPRQQCPFHFPKNLIEAQLCSSPYHFTYSPASLLAPPGPETFCPRCSCPGNPQQRGRARWRLFWRQWDSFLSPYLNVILV